MLANKEVYRLDISVGVSGDSESKSKLSAIEKMTQQTEKKMKALNKVAISPTAKITDNASSTISKIKSKASVLNNTKINPTAKVTDNASNRISDIMSNLKRIDASKYTATIRVKDEASLAAENILKKTEKLKSSVPTVRLKAEDQASSTINKIGNNLDNMGDKISRVGNKLSAGITLPIVGLGIAAGKIGMDFDSSMSRVKAISGATGQDFTKLKDQALQLGADTAFSSKQAAEGMENLASAGFATTEIMTAMPGMLDLAASSGEDLANSADIAASTLRGFGLATDQAGHVADVLAKNASATNAAVSDTGEALKYISPVAQTAGWSLESVAASIGELANSGIKGSQAGTILRATFSRLAKPSEASAAAMENMGFKAYDAQHKMKSLSTIVSDLQKSTANMTDEQKQNTIAQIFGEEAMSGVLTLIKNGPQALDDLTQSYISSDGAAKEMAKTMQDNAKSSIEQMMGSLETAGIKLEETFAPKIRDAANYVQDLANKFSALTPEQQNFYIKLALGAAALGPVIKLVGGLTSGIGGLIKVGGGIAKLFGGVAVAETTLANGTIIAGKGATGLIGAIAGMGPAGWVAAAAVAAVGVGIAGLVTYNDLMSKSVTTSTDDLNTWQKIVNKCTGSTIKSKAELIKAGVIYDDFGDGVSDSFKKAAQEASKGLLKIEMNINRLTGDNILDGAENNQLKNWVNYFAYEGISAIREKKSQIQSEFQKTFSLDGVTSTAEQGVADYLSSYFEDGVNKELTIRDEMYKIGDDAIKDHGKILDSDIELLKEKAAELQAVKLLYASAENAKEQAYAKSKFKSAAERVTGVDGASELLQERAKEHQSSVDETNANYDGTIAATKVLMNNEQNADKKETLRKGLEETEKARDTALKQAEEAWQSDLATLYEAYPKTKGMLNEKTGAKFSPEDMKKNQTLGTMTNSKFAGLTDVKENGMYSLINNDTGKYESVYAEVDKVTGEVIGAYSYCSGQVGGYTAEMAESAKKSALDISTNNFKITSSLDTVKSASVNAAGEMIGDGDRLISQLGQLQTAQDGTLYRTMSINGTPINVQVDSSGAILNLDEVRIKADEASKGRSVEITSNTTDEITKAQEYKTTMEAIPPNTDAHINSNASEVTSQTSGLLGKLQYITSHPWTAFLNFVKSGSSSSDYTNTEQDTYDENRTHLDANGNPYATGTSNATRGYHDTAERGFEIMIGRKNRWFNGGERVLTHQQSKSFLQNQQNNEPFQVKQGQYQLAQPQQVQVASAGGNNVQVDVQVNGGNQDIEGLIVEVTQEVGRKLKEALTNIKK